MTGFTIGLFIGVIIGFFAAALLSGSDRDER